MTTDRIPLAAVLGHPIAHSRSPQLHGYWLKHYGLAGHYVPIDVHPDDLENILETLPRMGFVGCNVTIPHKEAVIGLADQVSDRASSIGSANTLTFRADGSVFADNTDGVGFIGNLRQNAPEWRAASGPAVVFGAGGAARAVVHALLDAGSPQVRIANRTRSRADALQDKFGERVTALDWAANEALLEGAVTVVNTTSLGMTGHPAFSAPLSGLSQEAIVTDLVYSPLDTDFLKTARKMGCRTVDGLGMLLHQAVPGFEAWFGRRPEVDEPLRAAVLAT